MGMTTKARTGIIAGAAVGALALAAFTGTAMANAAGTVNTPSPSASANADQHQQRPVEEALTGDSAAKVKAAVEAKYTGATIDRMEKDADGQSVYEAHITKADGTKVTVKLDANYAITGEDAFGQGGKDAKGAGHAAEEALTGDSAAKVKAAVEAKYTGATIDRMEKDADGQSVYEAHITKADGTKVTVKLDANYAITGEDAFGQGGHRGHGGKGGHHQDGANGPSTSGSTSSAKGASNA